MSRLENLLKWYREHPDNSANWDLERWRIERLKMNRMGVLFGLIVAFMFCLDFYFVIPTPLLPRFLFGLLLVLFPFYDVFVMSQNIRRLEEEGSD